MRNWLRVLCIVTLTLGVSSRANADGREQLRSETIGKRSLSRLSVGSFHSCVAPNDGVARCWGSNSFDQLGDPTIQRSLVPVVVGSLFRVIAIDARHDFTCAVIANGTARCLGRNGFGQLGDGTTQQRATAVQVRDLNNVVAISGGEFHTCALIADGTARCWGLNTEGQLGDGTTLPRLVPVEVTGLTNAIAIAAGARHTCAVRSDGSASCWGRNAEGQLGDTSFSTRLIPTPVNLGAQNAVAITAGGNHTCALLSNGTASCWGTNNTGQLGNPGFPISPSPVPVLGLSSVVSLAAGASHTCAVVVSGQALCWGNNFFGQIGDGSFQPRNLPVFVSGLTSAIAIDGGTTHTCALRNDGTARCWGGGGMLGNGAETTSPAPTPVSNLTGSISGKHISGGGVHTCAVRSNSSASCWGDNRLGELGVPTIVSSSNPIAVANLSNAMAVALGGAHSCVSTPNGIVGCWGNNARGQLGDGTTNTRSTVLAVPNLNGVHSITAGRDHTCALSADGTARCWGENSSGQLGNDSTTDSPIPVQVTDLNSTNIRAVALSGGGRHTCAVVSNGILRCWGDNDNGQLGDGTNTNRDVPVPVVDVQNFLISTGVSIAAGGSHTCALINNGTVRCWGSNSSGQLGDGTNNDRSRAGVAIAGLDNVVAVVAGDRHSCALLANGRARCWGSNSAGQLGNGLILNFSTPVTVPGLVDAVALAAGDNHTCALLANGGVQCWGANGSGQVGDGTFTSRGVPVNVPSFTLNIDPAVELRGQGRVVTLNIIAVCDEGGELFVDVVLTQGNASGGGTGHGRCTGALEKYPLTVAAHGPNAFVVGPAQAQAEAIVRARGQVVDQQHWTRAVGIVDEQ